MNRCTKAILYKSNLEYNIKQIKNFIKSGVKLCIAVKADSYGHNAVLTSKIAESLGVEYLAVATVSEGVELRQAGIKAHILLLSLCVPEEFSDLFEYDLTPLVFGNEYIVALDKAAMEYSNKKLCKENPKKHSVFLAVDTGMGRIGCYPEEAGDEAKLINASSYISLKGLITHLCVSDSLIEDNQVFTKEQGEEFKLAVENVRKVGINPGILSCGASAGLLNYPDLQFDLVRPGIITYGYYPDEITKEYLKSQKKDFDIRPVLALETQIVAIRHFPKGKTVSYGRTYECPDETDIAILPIGYADGLLRRYSPGLEVTINGRNYPVRGRICMDQCMVDIGKNNKNVKLWDKVVIFGPKECGALNTAEDLARIGKTISYEVLTSITKRVHRIIK